MKKNAVIMAAGMSTRFVPLSFEKPKALLSVKGEILIERQIRQLREAGIDEIVIVSGYLKEQFKYLREKLGVTVLENPVYNIRNNHSTLYAARNYISNTFICSGDNYFTDNVFINDDDKAFYSAVYEKGDTDEWCLETDEQDNITGVTVGGRDSWVMKGHAFFDEKFSEVIIPYIIKAYHEEDSVGKYWEEIFMEHMDELTMKIKRYDDGIIEEFDSLEELRQFDSAYECNTGRAILENIASFLKTDQSKITDITPVKESNIVTGFTFSFDNKLYKYSKKSGEIHML